jgi:protein TonB
MSKHSSKQQGCVTQDAEQRPASQQPECHLLLLKDPSLLASLAGQIREWAIRGRTSVRAAAQSSRLPFTDMPAWYRDLPAQLATLFQRQASGTARAGSVLAGGAGIWRDFHQQPASWGNSLLVHLVALTALIIPYATSLGPRNSEGTRIREKTMLYLPRTFFQGLDKEPHGGGGSGTRSLTLPSMGAIPPFAAEQMAPPLVRVSQVVPTLPVPPTLIGPPNVKLAEMGLKMDWGDPTGAPGPTSGGPGSGGSFGTGDGPGIGPGKGPGYGPGEDGGFNGSTYRPGRGSVTEPVPVFKPEPPYTEEARKAKYQGVVDLAIVIDPQGNVADVRVVRSLGLGLDESAAETVKRWKFKPSLRNGVPVPVRVMVQVSFRLF